MHPLSLSLLKCVLAWKTRTQWHSVVRVESCAVVVPAYLPCFSRSVMIVVWLCTWCSACTLRTAVPLFETCSSFPALDSDRPVSLACNLWISLCSVLLLCLYWETPLFLFNRHECLDWLRSDCACWCGSCCLCVPLRYSFSLCVFRACVRPFVISLKEWRMWLPCVLPHNVSRCFIWMYEHALSFCHFIHWWGLVCVFRSSFASGARVWVKSSPSLFMLFERMHCLKHLFHHPIPIFFFDLFPQLSIFPSSVTPFLWGILLRCVCLLRCVKFDYEDFFVRRTVFAPEACLRVFSLLLSVSPCAHTTFLHFWPHSNAPQPSFASVSIFLSCVTVLRVLLLIPSPPPLFISLPFPQFLLPASLHAWVVAFVV